MPLTDTAALTMMERGDNWTGTNAFKALTTKNATPLNRFNLATGYLRTGRLDQAKTLYEGLVTDGQYTLISTVVPEGRSRTVSAADEAASRLVYIQWLQKGGARRVASASYSGAVSADAAGVPVAAIEGPIGDVSDEQAAILDRAATSHGGRGR